MKIYSIVITVIAVCALGLAGYFYWQSGEVRNNFNVCQNERDQLQTAKAGLENSLSAAQGQLAVIRHTSTALNYVLNSFMYAGDIKAITVGTKESVNVKSAFNEIDDNMDRMSLESSWSQFEKTLLFNPLFGVIRGLSNNIERTISQPAGNLPPVIK